MVKLSVTILLSYKSTEDYEAWISA